ncbi:hypothetical protein [Goekera deserti]|uniref:Uncharacterized protein n=1 Tax=Goekera deserti TaxID=2497753 RepID=A0A7K3W9H4_9ACTN|nr:hypothetical protein [Goekera deserti]NDI49689.1 hypothetical protein [Goekera deserti]NEL53118.1 hypothetical protein [Goekera deserti]
MSSTPPDTEPAGGPLHDPDAQLHVHPGPRDEGGDGGMATRELAEHRTDDDTSA